MKIDSHHHFWDYSTEEYAWISDDMEVLRQDYGPAQLKPLLEAGGVNGAVSVQARTSLEENRFLLNHARQTAQVLGVVGWVDLTDPGVGNTLEGYAMDPLMKGFRHVLQGESDDRYMLREDFNRGVGLLHEFGFTYDILIKHYHLPHVPAFVDQHPGLDFVIDHIAKPVIDGSVPDPTWVQGMQEAARREKVCCKISGMVTEVTLDSWSADLLTPWMDAVLEAFGPDRIMFGSDWPVCRLRAEYGSWLSVVEDWVAQLSADEQAAILGGTAQRFYDLSSA